MMKEWHWSFYFVLVIMEGRLSVAGTNSTFACTGDVLLLFSNVINEKPAYLYKNGLKPQLLAHWGGQTGTASIRINMTTQGMGYSKKLFLDKYGDLWIRNVYLSDEAQYVISDSTGSKYEVNLTVLDAPSLDCKPVIKRVEDVLIASLKADYCGKPAASVQWLRYTGIKYDGKDLAKLPPKNKAGTYYACIEGPAVRCARNTTISGYCSSFTIDEFISESSAKSSPSISLFVWLVVYCVIISMSLAILILNTYINCNLRLSKAEHDANKDEMDTSV